MLARTMVSVTQRERVPTTVYNAKIGGQDLVFFFLQNKNQLDLLFQSAGGQRMYTTICMFIMKFG